MRRADVARGTFHRVSPPLRPEVLDAGAWETVLSGEPLRTAAEVPPLAEEVEAWERIVSRFGAIVDAEGEGSRAAVYVHPTECVSLLQLCGGTLRAHLRSCHSAALATDLGVLARLALSLPGARDLHVTVGSLHADANPGLPSLLSQAARTAAPRPRMLVFEGPDGTGKTTLLRALRDALSRAAPHPHCVDRLFVSSRVYNAHFGRPDDSESVLRALLPAFDVDVVLLVPDGHDAPRWRGEPGEVWALWSSAAEWAEKRGCRVWRMPSMKASPEAMAVALARTAGYPTREERSL